MRYEIGKEYLVDVAVYDLIEYVDLDEDELWLDRISERTIKKSKIKHYELPIYNNRHNDIESGQNYDHYHVDTRFTTSSGIIRINLNDHILNFKIEKRLLKCVSKIELYATDNRLVKHNLKNKTCEKMINFKCIHKGYDLSNIEPIDGIITCPLHNLKYCSKTHKVINYKNFKKN